MMARLSSVFVLLFALALPGWCQDTRGSLLPDVLVLTEGGTIRADEVKAGTALRSSGGEGSVKVTAVRRQHTDTYYLLSVAGRELHATGSLRVARADGTLVRLDTVKAGDRVLVWGAKGAEPAAVTSLRVLPATMVAYDLTVEGHLTFVAGGVVVGD